MRREVAKTSKCPVTGKVSYRDSKSAARALRNVSHSVDEGTLTNTGKMPVRYYQCEFCAQFHLTAIGER